MATHDCPECGLTHSIPERGDSEAVRIARINADRDIEVARLARNEARQEIAAEVEIAETQADAAVEAAVAEAVVTTTILAAEGDQAAEDPPAEAPVIEAEPVITEPAEDGPPAPPEAEHEKTAKSGAGYWSGYSSS